MRVQVPPSPNGTRRNVSQSSPTLDSRRTPYDPTEPIDAARAGRLPPHLEDVLVGMVLGDAHLDLPPGRQHAHVQFLQSSRQETFVRHLFDLFQDWRWATALTPYTLRREEKTYTGYRFPARDLCTLQALLEPHLLESFRYKLLLPPRSAASAGPTTIRRPAGEIGRHD